MTQTDIIPDSLIHPTVCALPAHLKVREPLAYYTKACNLVGLFSWFIHLWSAHDRLIRILWYCSIRMPCAYLWDIISCCSVKAVRVAPFVVVPWGSGLYDHSQLVMPLRNNVKFLFFTGTVAAWFGLGVSYCLWYSFVPECFYNEAKKNKFHPTVFYQLI